ncbi:MAG: DNA-binding MarR family transcriptional regulator [Flavobacterium sp.]|jgi:DNA-binding MarR family transcriptional regulator
MTIEEIIKSTINLPVEKKIILNIMYTLNVIQDTFNDILKPHDLSSEQYNVLRILRGQKGIAANMFLIQERMVAKNSNTTRLIDKLLLKKLVTRNVCEFNRRKIEIEITQAGLDLLKNLDPQVEKHENSLSENLTTTEKETLNQLLEKYRTN